MIYIEKYRYIMYNRVYKNALDGSAFLKNNISKKINI